MVLMQSKIYSMGLFLGSSPDLELHPTGPKHNYDYHTEAMDRAMEGGIDDVGLGVLFGLELYKYEFAGLIMHAEHSSIGLFTGSSPDSIASRLWPISWRAITSRRISSWESCFLGM